MAAGDRTTGRGVHPYSLRNTVTNPLATMVPLSREQALMYHMGQRRPPAGFLVGHAPTWEAINFVLTPQGTLQARVNVQRDFTLISITASSSSNLLGGFRAQFYDVKRQVRLADRGVTFALIGGVLGPTSPVAAFSLREPYRFPEADSQILVVVQNLEAVNNTIDLALYGLALPFNAVVPTTREFPGGIVSSASNTPKKKTGSAQQ
jgi:hypothetical protein